jgi:23S rRNA (cytosine1962-C5)-methyltransferase
MSPTRETQTPSPEPRVPNREVTSDTVTITQRGADRILGGHLWVYRSDLLSAAEAKPGAGTRGETRTPAPPEPGSVVRVQDQRRRYLGRALYSSKSQLALRFLTRERRPFDRPFLAERIAAAANYRELVAAGAEVYRLVASEGDLLPSLTVDRYGDCLVLQTLSQGMERLKPLIVEILQEQFSPRSIMERNDSPVRALEDLPEQRGILAGEPVQEVVAREGGVRFVYDLAGGHKTGGYLDQRENRAAARRYARGRLLDCFTYTGGFALALAAQCSSVLALDSSQEALNLAQKSQALNRLSNIEWREVNCFDFLKAADRSGDRFETVVLDPPAFARQKSSLESALRGYKELNLRAFKILKPGGFLITCSCSFHVGESDFLEAVASAALDAHQRVQVVERRTQARDHPILLTVPETHYLKCLILRVAE